MEKTNLSILFFLFLLTSLCNSQDYEYDENYNYYNENYDYYSQDLNDYLGNENRFGPGPSPVPPPFIPPPLPPTPPPPTPQPGIYIIVSPLHYQKRLYNFNATNHITYVDHDKI